MITTVIDMRPTTATELTTAERAELGRYEAVIKRGLDTFFEVGNALAKIRDDRLYRGEYSTFEEYCRGRWEFTDRRARMLIDAAEVIGNLESGTVVPVMPTSERQARPLTKLEPSQQRVVWQEAVADAGGKQPTAAQVERAVERVRPPRPKPTPPASKVVYTEPVAKAEASNPLAPRVTGIEKIDGVTVHHMEFAATLPKTEPKAAGQDYIEAVREQATDIIAVLVWEPTATQKFVDALDAASAEQLREAIKQVASRGNIGRVNRLEWRLRQLERQPETASFPSKQEFAKIEAAVEQSITPAAIEKMRESAERSRRVRVDLDFDDATDTDPDEAEAVAIVAAEQAEEDEERAARDAQRPSFERVPEPVAVDNLDRLKRAGLLRYMLVQARDAARRDYGDLTGRHTDLLGFERGVADMLPALDSLIAILEGTK